MHRARKVGALLLIGTGMVLLVASGAYYAYSYLAKSNLDDLNFESERPTFAAPVTMTRQRDGSSAVQEAGDAAPAQALRAAPAPPRAPAAVDSAQGSTADDTVSGTASASESAVAVDTADPDVASTGAAEADQGLTAADALDPSAAERGGELLVSRGVTTEQPQSDSDTSRTDAAADTLASRASARGVPALNDGESIALRWVESQQPTVPQDDRGGASGGAIVLDAPPSPQAAVGAPGADLTTDDIYGTGDSYGNPIAAAVQLPAGAPFETAGFQVPTLYNLPTKPLAATRISVPAIDVDSDVSELRLDISGSNYAWETPKGVVGHVPTSAKPGGRGQGWYFGHLESPIRGEGNVFKKLPEIPPLLKSGETVQVLLESSDGKYLYEVYRTEWVHRDDLRVTDSGENDITLVTCYPTLVYDHRLLVTAALVGVSDS